MYPVSVCIIARNEAHNLPAAIASVQSCVEEIIVLDTGSTDNTVEVAQELGIQVHCKPWQDDFSLAKNKVISYATSDYILVLDSDEQLLPESRTAIQSFIEQSKQKTA